MKNVKNAVKKNYYDENFRGIDLDERFEKVNARLDEVSTTGQAFGAIAQALIDFDDSHLYFIPPSTNLEVEYGWRHKIFGDKLFVTLVKPGSDAEKKGLSPGDQIIGIEGTTPSRKELWKVMYFYEVLSKRPAIKLSVLSPGASSPKEISIDSKLRRLPRIYTAQTLFKILDTTGKSMLDYNYFKTIGNVTIWKMPSFSVDPNQIDVMVGKVRSSQNLILDLRGNGGGRVDALERLVSFMFDKDLVIAERKGRKPMDPMVSKTRGDKVFSGNLVVLIDANSASASEIFARLVQLEGRGKVVGDVSSGAVMQALNETLYLGGSDEIAYGVSVTNADVIFSDRKSLEHVGVVPDETVIPSGTDLRSLSDPVLAKAFELLGTKITPTDAGTIFRLKWTENSKGEEQIEIITK